MPHIMGKQAARWITIRRAAATDGEFYCDSCGGDRSFHSRTRVRWLRLFGAPLFPRGRTGPLVECAECATSYGRDALETPTSRRFVELLRDATRALALAALSAGGTSSPAARSAAIAATRDADLADDEAGQLVESVTALDGAPRAVDGARRDRVDGCAPALAVELQAALEPLAAQLAAQGRARLLHVAAGIALADGAYSPDERTMLLAAGRTLDMPDEDIEQVLKQASSAGR